MSNKLKKDTDTKKKKPSKSKKRIDFRAEETENKIEKNKKDLKVDQKVSKDQKDQKDQKAQNDQKEVQEQKVITKYDRKLMKRKKEAEKAARTKKITLITAIVLAVVIVAGSAIGVYSTFDRIHNQYIAIDDEAISQIEFDFYYNLTKQNMLSQTLYGSITYLSYFESYLGYDSSEADTAQTYSSTDYTWYDYFANTTLTMLEENIALLKAADDNDFTYSDGDSDYETFCSDIADAASSAGESVADYYKSTFGSHATESNLKPYIYEYLKASAYQEQLQSDLAPTDTEIADYYSENQDTYDTVTYRSFEIEAVDDTDDASITAAKEKADAMAAAVTDEASFAELCKKNATEDQEETYADDAASLSSSVAKSSISSTDVAEWLFDSSRTEGEVTVIEDTENSTYTVVYFISREKPDTTDDTISSTLLSQNYSEFIEAYTDNMKLNNIKNRIKMYSEES